MSSFHYAFDAFQDVTISVGDDKVTAKWGGTGDLDFLLPLSNTLYLASYLCLPVERIDDENGNLTGISFSLGPSESDNVVIQKDDCGYLEVLNGNGERQDIEAIPDKLAYLLASRKTL